MHVLWGNEAIGLKDGRHKDIKYQLVVALSMGSVDLSKL